jgi:hypothetical protein
MNARVIFDSGFSVIATLLSSLSWSEVAWGSGDAVRGATIFQACAACHSTTPGEHMTGPSLAKIWQRKAGTVESFHRYSDGKVIDVSDQLEPRARGRPRVGMVYNAGAKCSDVLMRPWQVQNELGCASGGTHCNDNSSLGKTSAVRFKYEPVCRRSRSTGSPSLHTRPMTSHASPGILA